MMSRADDTKGENMKIKKTVWSVVLGLVFTFSVQAGPPVVEWNANYYQVISYNGTWDEAKTAAEGLSYNGYAGHLVTLNSEDEFDFVKTITGLGDWNITWIGGYKSGSDYFWVNDEGTLDFSEWSADPWEEGYPAGDKGVAITGSGYGSNIRTQPGTCGEYIVEYSIPEPASAMLIACGAALIGLYRRCYGRG